MGSGRGEYKDLIAPVRPGDIICEIRTTAPLSIRQCWSQLRESLPFETRIVERDYNRPHMKAKKVCPTMLSTIKRYHMVRVYSKRVEFLKRVNHVTRTRKLNARNLINLLDPLEGTIK